MLWVHVNSFEWVLNALERGWTHSECAWPPFSEHWTQLNALECMWMPLSESECDWTHSTTDSYMKVSAHECLWVSVNAIECAWKCSECTWMPFSEYWTRLNARERALSVCECLWASIESNWMWLNVLECVWTPVKVILKKINRAGSNWMLEWNKRSF